MVDGNWSKGTAAVVRITYKCPVGIVDFPVQPHAEQIPE